MNCLIFFKDELIDETRAVVTGRRAQYLREWHDLRPGLEVRAGIWEGCRGHAKVVLSDDDRFEFVVNCTEPPLEKSPACLIVAVPRPQTVKKVIQSALSFGVKELHFIKSENVVPSYLSSKSLKEEGLLDEMLKAMEQTCDTVPLEVHVHKKWFQFCREVLPVLSSSYENRLIAHTKAEASSRNGGVSSVVAIGPESGWTDAEVEVFTKNGFVSVSLGARMLRVEHAVAKMLAAIDTI